jgi:chitodextrinase
MKKTILTVICFLAMTSFGWAASVSLEWDTLDDQSNGVRIYIGTTSEVYSNSHDAGVGVSEATVDNLVPGETYFFAAKAYDPAGNYSDFSNEVSTTIPSAPGEIILPELPEIPEIPIGNVTITIQIKEN